MELNKPHKSCRLRMNEKPALRGVKFPVAAVFIAICLAGCGNERLIPIPLTDLSAFEPVADNWQIVGDVSVDESGVKLMSGSPGTGVLFCSPTETSRDNLFTRFKHADMELQLEVMVPVQSNSGLYFQGRYEVQILDSWGVTNLRPADIGGIYQRWDPSRGPGSEGYEGHSPKVNAARKPGAWQQFRIKFRAPRFDAEGKKVGNARFEEVWLNGQLVQENVEVTGPTRASPFTDEIAYDALMIQGDHGPVALRNIQYRLIN